MPCGTQVPLKEHGGDSFLGRGVDAVGEFLRDSHGGGFVRIYVVRAQGTSVLSAEGFLLCPIKIILVRLRSVAQGLVGQRGCIR